MAETAPRKSRAEVAQYLERHNLEAVLNEAVNNAVLEESEEPVAHIAKYLARAAGISGQGLDAPAGANVRTVQPPPAEHARLDQLTEGEAQLAETLIAAGQQHVFRDWPSDPEDGAEKRSFFASLSALDASYPGGIAAYLANGKRLLEASRTGHNPLEGWSPAPPKQGHVLQPGTEEYERYEALGAGELHRVAFVIPAGGMGERLGYSGVKFGLPAEMTTETKVIGVYANYILAFESLARKQTGREESIPIAFMVSHDTRPGIEQLLREHNNFGLKTSQITFLQQEKVACFGDDEGRLAMRDRYTLETKPHGHGDVHFLLQRASLAQRWLSEGRKWICFFQDTNALYLATFLATLGVSEEHGLDMNSVCVPRRAKESIGAMAELTHTDGRKILSSVEYNHLEPLLRASGVGSDVNNPSTGFSPYPGNINKLLFRLPAYVAALSYSGGELPEFVNPKYATGPDEERLSTFKSPTRLECMMQDFAFVLQTTSKDVKVGYTQIPCELGYYPIKNNLTAAAELSARGIPPMGAASAEAAVYHAFGSLLRVLGCQIDPSVEKVYGGVRVQEGARIVFTPRFCPSVSELRSKFLTPSEVKISNRSTLVIDGEHVTVGSLSLDGALIIETAPSVTLHIENLEMRNKGWTFEPVSSLEMARKQHSEEVRMRGYRVEKHEELRVLLHDPGRWRIVNNTLVKDNEHNQLTQ